MINGVISSTNARNKIDKLNPNALPEPGPQGQGASTASQTVASTNGPPDANNAIRVAMSYIGTAYKWGGGHDGKYNNGLDCSGLVSAVYGLGGDTTTQVNQGTAVADLSQAQPGDLIFFGDPKAPHHVGIYVGNGQMIDAPHQGATVGVHAVGPGYGNVAAIRRVTTGGAGLTATPTLDGSLTITPNWQAHLQENVKGTPEYQHLFAHKADYQTEAQYGQQFQAEGRSDLGTDPSLEAIQAGMATGDPNTTYQHILGSGEGDKSPTFRGKLFTMAQLFNKLV
jgi:hypothetical protein